MTRTKLVTMSNGYEEQVCVHCEMPTTEAEGACCAEAQVEAAKPLVEAVIRFCATKDAPEYLIDALVKYENSV